MPWVGDPTPFLTSSTAVVLSPILSQKRMPCSLFSSEEFRFSAPHPHPHLGKSERCWALTKWPSEPRNCHRLSELEGTMKTMKGDSPKNFALKDFNFFFPAVLGSWKKWEEGYKDFPYILIPTASPINNIPHWNGTFVVTDEPTLTHLNHPESIVSLRIHSWIVRCIGLDKHI